MADKELLLDAARQAAKRAYCPYSNFHVGAAVLTESGEVITGCNTENATYGLALCAERLAICKAIEAGHKVKEIAVTCIDAKASDDGTTKMPCGMCRQVMAEFMDMNSEVHVDTVRTFKLSELLPHAFVLK